MRTQIFLWCLAWLGAGAVTGCFAVDYRYHVVAESSPDAAGAGGSGGGPGSTNGGPGSTNGGPGSSGGPGSGGASSSDPCLANPIALAPPGDHYEGSLGVGANLIQPSCGSKGKPEVVFAVTPAVTGDLDLNLIPAQGQDTTFSVRTGCGAQPTGQEMTCAASGGGLPLALSIPVVSGKTYYLVVDGDPQGFTLDLGLVEGG